MTRLEEIKAKLIASYEHKVELHQKLKKAEAEAAALREQLKNACLTISAVDYPVVCKDISDVLHSATAGKELLDRLKKAEARLDEKCVWTRDAAEKLENIAISLRKLR